MNMCEGLVVRDHMTLRCADTRDLIRWEDAEGLAHYACPRHQGALKRRFPAELPERTAPPGTLGLGTPWTRGAFGPADIIEVENAIPAGYRINIVGKSPRTFVVVGALVNPDTKGWGVIELFRSLPTSDPYRVALLMAERLAIHAEASEQNHA